MWNKGVFCEIILKGIVYSFSEGYNTKCNTKIKKVQFYWTYQAADGNRTRDLRTTNATLYRLSHSSMVGEISLAITKCIISKDTMFVNNKLNKFFEHYK